MNKKLLLCLGAALLVAACDSETRNGQLTLTGTSAVRVMDKDGHAVDFTSGPLKVAFGVPGGDKISVRLEQGDRKATMEARVPADGDFNFTLRGADMGQSFDLASQRKLDLYGEKHTSIGNGGSCGFDGEWVTEETWQKCNEDWKVLFTDTRNSAALGTFESIHNGADCLIATRDLYCRERHTHDRPGPRGVAAANKTTNDLKAQVDSGVKFD